MMKPGPSAGPPMEDAMSLELYREIREAQRSGEPRVELGSQIADPGDGDRVGVDRGDLAAHLQQIQ